MMRGHGFQDAAQQGAGFQRAMIGNRKVMRPANGGRQADVGTFLSCALITQHPQREDEVGSTDRSDGFPGFARPDGMTGLPVAAGCGMLKADKRTRWPRSSRHRSDAWFVRRAHELHQHVGGDDQRAADEQLAGE